MSNSIRVEVEKEEREGSMGSQWYRINNSIKADQKFIVILFVTWKAVRERRMMMTTDADGVDSEKDDGPMHCTRVGIVGWLVS